MATFNEIRLEIERTVAKVKEAEGENKRLLLRRLHRLIILADEAISTHDKLNPLADNLAIRRRLRNSYQAQSRGTSRQISAGDQI
jgi:hypothetical protein